MLKEQLIIFQNTLCKKVIYTSIIPIIWVMVSFNSCQLEKEQVKTIDQQDSMINTENYLLSKKSEYIIVIPDIQNYIKIQENHIHLSNIVNWILENIAKGYKINAVLQTGDVTEHNNETQWKDAFKLLSPLINKTSLILCTGNHDYGLNGSTNNRNTLYNSTFDYSVINSKYVQKYKSFENSKFKISINNKIFSIYSIQFAPTDDILNWIKNDITLNPSDYSILLTHAYLYKDKSRYNYSKYGKEQLATPFFYSISKVEKINDGEMMWEKLIYNSNFKIVICGHVQYIENDAVFLISQNANNNSVIQLLFNTQDYFNGGNEWIQLIEFNENNKINVFNYSIMFNEIKNYSTFNL